ncbi:NAD-dependent epimerase [Allohahella sp. A8]|uniref:NAD-dependent epimerase n=1 Tax=Allohahella sp. A8 TaxID=3141461 RepID=UPI000C090EAA|nr:capsular biosynthesis protein CpsI [Hahellaceae bacterium]|tara:strand:- start:45651 stop:46658 length:1008 start_codon:yes stop_codon:yes gene_type:complete
MKVLITGTAGFIGSHVALRLMARGDEVIGIDNLNDYYEVSLKEARLARLTSNKAFTDLRIDIADAEAVNAAFQKYRPDRVIHLAAQAGVRYSITNPHAYVTANLVGHMNILEACRHHDVQHLTYASSSSVYGANETMPFSIHDNVDHPLSLYAATKKSNELMSHTYSSLFGLPTTGLRFFTVYGPWGRPDMALFIFTKRILAGEPIDVFNYGKHKRDFTYIDDIVEGVIRTSDHIATPNENWSGADPDPGTSRVPYRVYNIGSNNPVELSRYIEILESCLGKKAERNLLPLQPGDVPATFADVQALIDDVGYKPATPVEEGISRFVDWYRDYYKV